MWVVVILIYIINNNTYFLLQITEKPCSVSVYFYIGPGYPTHTYFCLALQKCNKYGWICYKINGQFHNCQS